ncbi:MAG: FAD:protein FMN transferase, partial [Clostridiales bacterium]|nr:FAD:protein FMN transferase [Clostridiales bacterium]
MRKIFTRIGIAAMAACTLVSAAACGQSGELYAYDSFAYFNTQTRWAFSPKGETVGDDEAAVWGHIISVLQDVEYSVSTDIETSDISRFNMAAAGEIVEVGETTYNLLSIAQSVYEKTDGAYNPAVGLLVDLWGFSPRFTDIEPSGGMQPYDRPTFLAELAGRVVSELPDDEYIAAFRDLSDFSGVELKAESGKFYATKPKDAFAVIADGEGVEHTYT